MPVVLPTLVIAGCAGVAWAVRAARARAPAGHRRVAGAVAAVFGVLALVVPAAVATAPVAPRAPNWGSSRRCGRCARRCGRGTSWSAWTPGRANEWPQLIRGVCNHPAASFRGTPGGDTGTGGRAAGGAADPFGGRTPGAAGRQRRRQPHRSRPDPGPGDAAAHHGGSAHADPPAGRRRPAGRRCLARRAGR